MSAAPNGWNEYALGDVATWNSGSTPKATNRSYYSASPDIPWAVIGDLNDGRVTETRHYLSDDGLRAIGGRMVPVDAVLIAMYGSIGKTGIAGVRMATNQAILAGVAREDLITPGYLHLVARHLRPAFVAAGQGATQMNINAGIVRSETVLVPPITEQLAITRLIDKADAAVARASERREQAELVLRAAIRVLLPEAGENPCPLGDLLAHSRVLVVADPQATYRQVTIRLRGQGVVLRDEVPGDKVAGGRFMVREGQFILSKIDARHGAFGLVPPELDGAIVTNDFPAFDLSERLDADYLRWITRTSWFVDVCRDASVGTTNRVRLSENLLLSTEIPLPDISVQRESGRRLRSIERTEQMARTVEARLSEIRDALLKDLLTGRHRLA